MNRIVSSIFVIASLLCGFASAQSDADQKLELKWTMRNSGGVVVEDFSGKNHFGLLRGQAFFNADPRMQNTVTISGINGLVSTPENAELEPAQGTVETWIKADVIRNADIFNKLSSKLVRRGPTGGMSVYGMHLYEDGSFGGFVMNDDLAEPGPWVGVGSRPGVIETGKWYLVALRWDNQELALFLNGELLGTRKYRQIPIIGLSYSGDRDFSLGQATYWGGSDHGFLGQFGETRIYSRSLQNKEMREHYVEMQVIK
ncbi:MAG: hypothetical protein JWO20_106 [Candidatus Angelobacter sp.]|jgi:hypothetical protein|nr:hypothetical protein [Candidatus Angelobacter sp.]